MGNVLRIIGLKKKKKLLVNVDVLNNYPFHDIHDSAFSNPNLMAYHKIFQALSEEDCLPNSEALFISNNRKESSAFVNNENNGNKENSTSSSSSSGINIDESSSSSGSASPIVCDFSSGDFEMAKNTFTNVSRKEKLTPVYHSQSLAGGDLNRYCLSTLSGNFKKGSKPIVTQKTDLTLKETSTNEPRSGWTINENSYQL